MHQLFYFRFCCSAEYRSEEVVLLGTNHEDARTGAWALLGERVGDRNPRGAWRIVSMRQEPADLFSEAVL